MVDDRGERVSGWQLFGALALLTLKEKLGGKLVVPLHAPSLVERIAQQYGGSVVKTKADIQSLMAVAAEESATLASDGLGGMIFPQFHPGLDALYALARLYQLLLRAQVDLSEVVAALPEFHLGRQLADCPWAAKGRAMRILEPEARPPGVRQIDGVKVERGPQEWALVLTDVDRPLFHVVAEAPTEDGLRVLIRGVCRRSRGGPAIELRGRRRISAGRGLANIGLEGRGLSPTLVPAARAVEGTRRQMSPRPGARFQGRCLERLFYALTPARQDPRQPGRRHDDARARRRGNAIGVQDEVVEQRVVPVSLSIRTCRSRSSSLSLTRRRASAGSTSSHAAIRATRSASDATT